MKVDCLNLDEGRLTVARKFLPLLQGNDLASFASIMARDGGRPVRLFPGRRTVRLELSDGTNSSQAIYLKRYEPSYLSPAGRFLRRIHWPGRGDEAEQEWRMIETARALGIHTAEPIAFGQERRGGMVTRSFLMTREIAGSIEGHTFAQTLAPADRRRFLLRIAGLARQLHEAGFVHKDFYLGHVLVVPGPSEPGLHLIDLQRMTQPCCLRGRWIAKDLGAIAYSALNAGATSADLLSSYHQYCGTSPHNPLGPREKRIARTVLGRVAWLRTRSPKHDGPPPHAT